MRKSLLFLFLFTFCSFVKGQDKLNDKPFINPIALYGAFGSSIGTYYQTLWRLGKFNEMLKFTSKESIKKFGRVKILDLYQKMYFGYHIEMKSVIESDDQIKVINYKSVKFGTSGILRINISIENDTSKVILNSLNLENPF